MMLTGRETLDAYANNWSLPRVTTRAIALTAFADCAICGCSVNDCECDPDEYAAALYDRLRPSTLENRRDA